MAVVSFVIAVVYYREPPASECRMSAVPDPSYQVRFEEPPSVNLTTYHLLVSHNSTPVTGAQVCMRADMGGEGHMSGMGVNNTAREVSPGRYELSIRMEMGGHWQGASVVAEPGRKAVSVPLVYNAG
jgi:hypothetical protein